uniref:Elongation factor Tu n=1 Tax=Candidatus Methanosuratincola petrocarbonis (ex Vanwonterghem et al. 2016) TaxID=1867261 RepID=A0A7J3UZF9_9CREN
MGNLNVAVLGKPGFGAGLGKKGTASDITFYNLKRGEDTVTFIEPTKYPERLAPLFYAVSIAKMAILVVEKIDAAFGETALMLDSAGVGKGLIVLAGAPKEKVAQLVKGTLVERYEFFEGDVNGLREKMVSMASQATCNPQEGNEGGCVAVDHAFNVKGTGTVVLGTVMQGTVRRHDTLRAMPGGKIAQVRSIQKHDDDFETASEGDRVGLALKGVQPEDLERGCILTSNASLTSTKEIATKAEVHKYWTEPLEAGMVVHLGHWMQFVPGKIEAVNAKGDCREPEIKLSLGKEIAFLPGSQGVLMRLEGGKLRVVGKVGLPKGIVA